MRPLVLGFSSFSSRWACIGHGRLLRAGGRLTATDAFRSGSEFLRRATHRDNLPVITRRRLAVARRIRVLDPLVMMTAALEFIQQFFHEAGKA